MTAVNPPDGARARPQEIPCKSDALREHELEAAISAAMARMCAAPDRDGKMQHWREWVRLIDLRSPSRVRFLARLEQMQSPPSTSLGIAQATGECRLTAVGGVP